MTSRRRCERARRIVRENFDLVPLAEAQFLWDHNPDGPYPWPEQSFVVVPQLIDGIDPHAFSSSTGADSEGWPTANYNNPAFVLGRLLFRDWTSEKERIEAIAEFAKIDGVDWARELLRGMAVDAGAFDCEEDPTYFDPISDIETVEKFRDGILSALENKYMDED